MIMKMTDGDDDGSSQDDAPTMPWPGLLQPPVETTILRRVARLDEPHIQFRQSVHSESQTVFETTESSQVRN